jgi:hypothetical protein
MGGAPPSQDVGSCSPPAYSGRPTPHTSNAASTMEASTVGRGTLPIPCCSAHPAYTLPIHMPTFALPTCRHPVEVNQWSRQGHETRFPTVGQAAHCSDGREGGTKLEGGRESGTGTDSRAGPSSLGNSCPCTHGASGGGCFPFSTH